MQTEKCYASYNDVIGALESAKMEMYRRLVVPYEENFQRLKKHHSSIYFGASLNALYKLGIEKGYSLVGTNLNGSNAFFIKKDLIKKSGLLELKPFDCFNINSFNELRSKSGSLLERNTKLEDDIIEKMSFVEV